MWKKFYSNSGIILPLVVSPSFGVVAREQVFDNDGRMLRNQHPKTMLAGQLIELHYRPLSGLPFQN